MRSLKSRSSRRVLPLSPLIAEELRVLRHAGHESLPVFLTPAGAPINRPNLASRVLKPAGAEAGLFVERAQKPVVWVSFHSFRHTCASLPFRKEPEREASL
jgi:integrase